MRSWECNCESISTAYAIIISAALQQQVVCKVIASSVSVEMKRFFFTLLCPWAERGRAGGGHVYSCVPLQMSWSSCYMALLLLLKQSLSTASILAAESVQLWTVTSSSKKELKRCKSIRVSQIYQLLSTRCHPSRANNKYEYCKMLCWCRHQRYF